MNKIDLEKMFKWVKGRLGVPLINFTMDDDMFEIILEMVEEDLENHNITITSKFNRNVIISRLLLAESKKIIGRVRGAYGGRIIPPDDTSPKLDYEILLIEGLEERKAIYELLLDN